MIEAPPAVVLTEEEAASLPMPPLLVLRPLQRLLDELGIGSGELEAEPIGAGHSNVTYLLRRDGAEVVLRRPPRPPLAPSSHDVIREARIVRALEGSDARVPRVLHACTDERVIGAPFYLMERIEGDVVGERLPDRFADPEQRRRLADELVDALIAVHAADWLASGLVDLARHHGYLERQVRRFTELWQLNRTRDLPVMDRVTRWLGERIPTTTETTLVHGDYRLGNAMFAPSLPARLKAVLDWEMSTLGDPLADVGYLLANWPHAGEPEDPMVALSAVVRMPGFPRREDLVERYVAGCGRDASRLRWYVVLARWKSAVFLEGSYQRFLAGRTDDPFFATLRDGVPALAERAWAAAASSDRSAL